MPLLPSLLRQRALCPRYSLGRLLPPHFPTQAQALLHTQGSRKSFLVLGIESSCDDTAVALMQSDGNLLCHHHQSQLALHEPHKGIVPGVAMAAHAKVLPHLLQKVLEDTKIQLKDIDVVAATRGPGLPGCVSVGYNSGRCIAAMLSRPFIGVHHMEAHALTTRWIHPELQFPFVTLLVSGGHTLLVITRGVGNHEILASTLDDAMGEAFDKTARSLHIPWMTKRGAGAALERAAKSGSSEAILPHLTVPLSTSDWKKRLAFSFAGLKSQMNRYIQSLDPPYPCQELAHGKEGMDPRANDLAAAFQQTVIAHIQQKLRLGLNECTKRGISPKALVISGGVAANQALRTAVKNLCHPRSLPVLCPPIEWCGDNAAMIAWTGVERYKLGLTDPLDLPMMPKWSMEGLKNTESPEEDLGTDGKEWRRKVLNKEK